VIENVWPIFCLLILCIPTSTLSYVRDETDSDSSNNDDNELDNASSNIDDDNQNNDDGWEENK
jgi:hypothetical protein